MEKQEINSIIAKIEEFVLYAVIFLFPWVVVSISPNPFVVPKLAILTYGVLILLFLFTLRTFISAAFTFFVGSFDFPVFLIAISFILSTIFRTPNKMEALLLPGTTTAIILGVLLYFSVNQIAEKGKFRLTKILLASTTVFSLITMLSFAKVFEKIPQLPPYIRSQGFTPEGGFLPAFIFLTTLLPIGIGIFLSSRELSTKLAAGVASAIVVSGLVISIYNILPGKPLSPRFPSLSTSWAVSIDTLKDSPILGAGPANYLTAFSRFRPLSYNQTDLWAVKFVTARNFYLTTLTETGMLGMAGIILLLASFYKIAKGHLKEKEFLSGIGVSLFLSLAILITIFFFFPATVLSTITLFILLALNSKTHKTQLSLTTKGVEEANLSNVSSRVPALIVTIPIFVVTAIIAYRATTIILAEYKFQKSLEALAKNDASNTYDTIKDAIRANPFVDRYHATFARVNLALANAIAQRAATSSGETRQITDQDRQNITLLIQQAINEGKATVALNPLRSGNWEILAQVYRAIMPLAQGADNFAIQTYRQAIALDPINPNLRISFGGIYFAKADFESAIRAFELAVAAKPDHANAHYNLAIALREKGNLDRAIQEMTAVLSLLDRNSPDFELAQKTLEDLQAKKKTKDQKGEELTPPEPAPSPIITPPVELPEGSEPPESPLTPTPSPTPTPAS